MRRAFLAGLVTLSLAACATQPATQRYSGTLDWSFETSAFRTDDGRGPWWLSADRGVWDQVVAPIRASGRGPYGQVRLTVEGDLSQPGHYGHMGAYERSLRVTRVIDAQLISASGPPQGS